ncbi:WYL domain-containing protein [Acinetobacter haemolyticus]|uniref:helix-turn-helix transcriptional regulator n=1 Tax=Acinetobacter haemolyticus TaxID=29430 RepID=UPI000E5807E1|nr:WYL domain-containing protein [Acinetobacter haemolyticus]NAR49380.1 WYL domain-containing protein [Acinetobacter haemolyticus]NAR56477.1 WYL domain-containing protein [Acinetobacter haemolyticus]NAR79308.1 WYL domain-containing protein [Acinetobacter haemolyticus]NAR89073.1 WYL domain-containing protein [Acinetobacter haemolyticus]NAR96814.1 WYL domain-containing protein [Acinetobacter haemolyticus]
MGKDKQPERSEQLAERLAKILVKLNGGAHLDVKTLADEFGVSERTIVRDIARFESAELFIKRDDQRKYYIDVKSTGMFKQKDIKNFAKISGIQNLYPNLTIPFLSKLLDHDQCIYEAKGYTYEDTSQFESLLKMFSEAIEKNQQISFLYNDEPRVVEPYRLIHHHGSWYLAAVRKAQLRTYRLSRIKKSYHQHELATFKPDSEVLEQLENEDSIWFGQEKSEVILKVHPDVVLHFQQRQLFPEQEIVKKLEDGGLLVSSRISHAMQLLPLVRYWIPHVEIVSPEGLHDELEDGLKRYLAN